MPVYVHRCNECNTDRETIQRIGAEPPVCCGKAMKWLPTAPSKIQMCEAGGVKLHTRGYKDDYAKEYKRRMGVES